MSGRLDQLDAARLHPGHYRSLVGVTFHRAVATDLVVPLDEAHLAVMWSEFYDCTFTQRSRRLMEDGAAAQGSFGNRPSLYQGCTFTRIQFGSPGRFGLGRATFEDCVFDNCAWRSVFSYDADLIRCRFVGKMQSGAFGSVSPGTGRASRFVDNDFSGADIGENFSWRFDFPVAQQRWPNGYTPLQDL